jgi:dimethylargininase
MYIAITRQVSRSILNCELSYLRRESIDVARARKQHAQYEAALRALAWPSCPPKNRISRMRSLWKTRRLSWMSAPSSHARGPLERPEAGPIRAVLTRFRSCLTSAPRSAGRRRCPANRKAHLRGLSERSNAEAVDQLRPALIAWI